MNIKWVGSPNFTRNRQDSGIKHIVVHHMVGTLTSADAVFQDTQRNTSAHYGVGQAEIHQYVDEADTAYHAGVWSENLQSIGIEHEDFGKDNFTDAVYANSAELIRTICSTYGLPIDRSTIHPHNEFIATTCPGGLDINRLIKEAIGESMPYTDQQYNSLKDDRDQYAEDWARERYLLSGVKAADIKQSDRRLRLGLPWTQASADLNRDLPLTATPYELTQQVNDLTKKLSLATSADPNSIVISAKGWAALWAALQSFFGKNK